MNVRPATPADIPAMRVLEAQADTAAHWDQDEYQRLLAHQPPRLALVVEEDAVRGFLIARQTGPEWEIENLVVGQPFRRRGLAATLLRRFFDLASRQGGQAVFLEVRASNAAARALYARFGFIESGRRRHYYHSPLEDAVLYRLPLPTSPEPAPDCTGNRALPKSG